ncbi:hypothetical protein [Nocardia bhagyanarayanae]|uniref:Outer membrane channel protein CpnT-like N-terminal domain-containing protein n=1 Tax=Nocardia bhagyanarayanae TaxID=1215925 RepID=A0A543FBI5_9NOCA|nr:hypothetical protein [Nocardia bhagyanarayanae]TQM31160.1 hypothetical protein FB390_2813 [Nocardia bhagyanarayanae]
MGLEIPDALKPVAAVVVYKWPETDETGLRAAADRWDQIADLLDQVNDLGDDVVKVVLANTEGETHDAIDAFWKNVGGDGGTLQSTAEFCRELAFVLRVMAMLVLAVKLYIISMLVFLAIQLAAAAAAAAPTLGASLAEGAAVQVAVRTAITQALKKLIQEIGVRTIVQGAVLGAGVKGGIEVGFQSLEIKLGVRDGYDGFSIASNSIYGAISGAVAAPVSKLLNDKGVSLTGNPVSDWTVNYLIGKKVGNTVADMTWGEQESITERAANDAIDYTRNEIVESLTAPSNDSQPGNGQNPSSTKPSTADQGSSLDLPVQ